MQNLYERLLLTAHTMQTIILTGAASMKKKFFVTILLLGVFSIYASGLFAGGRSEQIPPGKIVVATTFDAIKELALVVGKDKIYLKSIIPDGMEAHHFEPKVGDLRFLNNADFIFYNGLGMEPWLDNAVKAVTNKKLMEVCVTDGIDPITLDEDHAHTDCDCCCGHHGGFDPHAWLSLQSAKIMVMNISTAFIKADPANAAFYRSNAHAFIAEADKILSEYQQKFEALPNKRFVTGHAAFGYLCRDFGLEQSSVEDVFSAGEPTAKQLAMLTDYCKKHGITTVFTEYTVSPEVSKSLAKEVGAQVETIYTIETAEDNLSYMDRMKINIERIYKSLKQ